MTVVVRKESKASELASSKGVVFHLNVERIR